MSETWLTYIGELWPTSVSETWLTCISETWLTYVSETYRSRMTNIALLQACIHEWDTTHFCMWDMTHFCIWDMTHFYKWDRLTYVSETCRSWPVCMCVTPSRPLSFHTRTISLCRTSMCLSIFVSMSVSMSVSVYVYAYVCVYMCVCVCISAEEKQCIHGGCSRREGLGCPNFPQGLTHILSLVLSDSISLSHTYICAHMCVSDQMIEYKQHVRVCWHTYTRIIFYTLLYFVCHVFTRMPLLSCFLSLSLARALSVSLSLTHTHAHTRTLTLSREHTHAH